MKSVTPNIRGVTERHCPSKGTFEVGIIRLLFKYICYRKIAKSHTKDARELHAALRTMFENHCSTSNTTPTS